VKEYTLQVKGGVFGLKSLRFGQTPRKRYTKIVFGLMEISPLFTDTPRGADRRANGIFALPAKIFLYGIAFFNS
jgi:hypothetical protein